MSKPTVKTHLRNPTFKVENGKVVTITGQCSERGCKNTRTIKPQDAFQVRRCAKCQKAHLYAKRAEKRKAKAAKKNAKAKHVAQAMAKVLEAK